MGMHSAKDLITLSALYRTAAGNAFAVGDDTKAHVYREAARKLDELAEELPELPRIMRGG